jgi:hypothetical protein
MPTRRLISGISCPSSPFVARAATKHAAPSSVNARPFMVAWMWARSEFAADLSLIFRGFLYEVERFAGE